MDISGTIHLLGDLLGQVLIEQESQHLFEVEESIRMAARDLRSTDPSTAALGKISLEDQVKQLDISSARVIASAFALYFDLVNTAEDNSRITSLRQEALTNYPLPVHDSIEEAVRQLKNRGITANQMDQLLSRLQIEIVLTAHPTESRRRTILSKIQRISDSLQMVSSPGCLPAEVERSRRDLFNEITTLWLTDRSRTSQPAPSDEVKTTLYFVGQVFWNALPEIYDRLETALTRYYPGLAIEHPWFRLASWIGGDRDGNPNVTVDVTAETLRLHRGLALENYRRSIQELSRRLSLSSLRMNPPDQLKTWLSNRNPLPSHVAQIRDRYPFEPFRLALALLAADIAEASQDDMKSHLLSNRPHNARIHKEDLTWLLRSIYTALPPAIADGPIKTAIRQVNIFGLHGARLDLREDSSRINAALGEVFRAFGITPDFENQDQDARKSLLLRMLSSPKPPLAIHPGVSEGIHETWALFQLVARTQSIYGRELIGPFIISMTHGPADLLAVLLMATWTGCADGLSITPLFETIHDLEQAAQVMAELFETDAYRAHLQTCPAGQMVMVGYSDSNKDGGFVMSNWALYQAQEVLTRTCRQHQVPLTLFHGRGGTAARGGGPINRAILAQPGCSVDGRFRLTEQGETLSSRYSNYELALRNLEQIVNAVLLASAPNSEGLEQHVDRIPGHLKLTSPVELPGSWRQTMHVIASAAIKTYRDLVYETPGFMDYWQAATPIDEIKHLHIGSRPSARQSGNLRKDRTIPYLSAAEEISKIRAIPWVFSWMQSRFNLPGWYGLGSGLDAILKPPATPPQPPSSRRNELDKESLSLPEFPPGGSDDTGSGIELLRTLFHSWAFFRVLIETAELSLLKADMQIASIYDELVPDRVLAEQIFMKIKMEYLRTVDAILAIKDQESLLSEEPVIQRSVQLRNPYIDPLNYLQVEMLRKLRSLPDPESPEAQSIRDVVVLTINGIAAGLRNTG